MNEENPFRMPTKGEIVGILLFLIPFLYYSYQDTLNQESLARSLDEGAARRRAFEQEMQERILRRKAELDSLDKIRPRPSYWMTGDSDIDRFNDHLDDFLSDPEDEITYSPDIYEWQIDDEEKDYIENDLHY